MLSPLLNNVVNYNRKVKNVDNPAIISASTLFFLKLVKQQEHKTKNYLVISNNTSIQNKFIPLILTPFCC